jgi:protein SCO1/2
MRRRSLPLGLLVVAAVACAVRPEPHRFQLTGQVVALQPSQRTVTVRHQDIPGFMPAMTMPFKVQDAGMLGRLAPGDLVTATLVVLEDDAYLAAIERTGHADLPPPAAAAAPAVELMKPGDALPDAELIDQDGRPFKLSSLTGSAVVVTFIYTRCPLPNFCPLMNRNFAAIQRGIALGRLRGVRLLSISFDPAFDTPAVLKAHATAVGADPAVWTFLTGDAATIESLGARLGLAVMREADDPASITHNLRTAVFDRQGKLKTIYNGNEWTPPEILADLASMPGS